MSAKTHSHIQIDGSQGEGGGQILRSALTLSMLTGTPFTIEHIRAKRKKPGLLRQHLTAVNAATRISSAYAQGAELGSSELTFEPGPTHGGVFDFTIGSAGSTMLILQTILLPLCIAKQPSKVMLAGGTHNHFAPPFEFLQLAFMPLLERMGASVRMQLIKPGFFPAGGGKVEIEIDPCAKLKPFELHERGELKSRQAIAIVNNLPENIADRELKVARDRLKFERKELKKVDGLKADGPGNIFMIELICEHITEVFAGFGEIRMPAEGVARKTCDQAERYLKSDAPVGDYLADQLLLPFAIAGGGSFRCTALTPHFETNVAIIERFLPIKIHTEREGRLAWRVTITK